MKNVHTPSAKRILVTLKLTAAASATEVATQNKIFKLWMTVLIISNTER